MTHWSRLAGDVSVLESALDLPPSSGSRPALIVLSGLPGSGKTYLAREICRRYPLAHVESDLMRKALFSRPVYTAAESTRLFAAVHALVDELLHRCTSVLIDATNLRETHRSPLYEMAERRGARLLVVRVEVPDRVARQRLEATGRGLDPENRSDADLAVYELMRSEQEPIRRKHLRVDASGSIAAAVDKIVRELKEIV